MNGFIDSFISATPATVGVWIVITGLAVKWSSEYRAWRKLPAEEQQANREGFTAQVELLQRQLRASDEENRRTRAEMVQNREELHTAREQFDSFRADRYEEEHKLKNVIMKLEAELAGLRQRLTSIAVKAIAGKMTSEDAQELHGIAVFFQDRETKQ